ncbi:MAG: hypothetical protein NTX38_04200 [Methylobacter sp.]|nr:hypothetical protein [Methylobacter sp.]
MAKLDELKESLNTLRTALSLLSAFLIAMGGALGALFKSGDIGVLFWVCAFFMALFILAGFIVITKIKQKTKEIETYDGYFGNVNNWNRHFCDVFIFNQD